MATLADGKVVQVIGPVIYVEFPAEGVPDIYTALKIDDDSGNIHIRLTAEVQQQIGRNQVRAVAMSATDGLVRGTKVVNTGAPIQVPVGDACLGRVFNLLGEPVDYGAPLPAGMMLLVPCRWTIAPCTPPSASKPSAAAGLLSTRQFSCSQPCVSLIGWCGSLLNRPRFG